MVCIPWYSFFHHCHDVVTLEVLVLFIRKKRGEDVDEEEKKPYTRSNTKRLAGERQKQRKIASDISW